VSFRIGTCNAHAPGSAAANEATIKAAAASCDVLLVQEADSQVIAALHRLKGWTVVTPGGLGNRNPIAYRSDKFQSVAPAGWRRIYKNKANVKDGPDRSMTWAPLRELSTGLEFCPISVHMIHQAFTSHPERQPGWLSSLAVVGPTMEILRQRHGRVIIGGDWNNTKTFNIPGVRDIEVASPATFGANKRYDRFFLAGDLKAGKVFKKATPSDHDTLIATVTLKDAVVVRPAPKPAPKEETVARGICPFAKQRIIPPGDNDPRISPRVAILHVDAGDASSLYDYFKNRSGGIESHFHVRRDGVIEQYHDIYHQADANRDANDFAVSIETQGYGRGEWTPQQLASIKRLLLWLNQETKGAIPLRRVDRWDGSGVGYHTIWGSPSHWTPVAKSCPGPDRIKQFNTNIVPWLLKAREGKVTEEDEMEFLDWSKKSQEALVEAVAKAVWREMIPTPDAPRFAAAVLRNIHENTRGEK
jgi:hypothetical protein